MSKIKIGDKAPAFSAPNQDEKTISLSDFKGKNLMLAIYVRDGSSGCVMDLQNIQDDLSKIKKAGFEVVGISTSSTESHKKFKDKLSLKFDLLSDPDSKIIKSYDAYGAKGKKDGKTKYGTIRHQIFIDDKGKICGIIDEVDVKNSGQQILDYLAGDKE